MRPPVRSMFNHRPCPDFGEAVCGSHGLGCRRTVPQWVVPAWRAWMGQRLDNGSGCFCAGK